VFYFSSCDRGIIQLIILRNRSGTWWRRSSSNSCRSRPRTDQEHCAHIEPEARGPERAHVRWLVRPLWQRFARCYAA